MSFGHEFFNGDHKFANKESETCSLCAPRTRSNNKKNDEDIWQDVRDNKRNFIKIYTHVMESQKGTHTMNKKIKV